MSKYAAINAELARINDASFQTVCNHFLVTEFGYDLFTPGSVISKDKTKKGKPDAFIRTKEGKYILAEYTTQDNTTKTKKAFLKKLEGDLRDVLISILWI